MANVEQIRLWNDVNASRWIRFREELTRSLSAFGSAALEALSPQPGEAALDVGCGFGETTVALARRTGNALGIDVCEPFLEIARAEASAGARYRLADAQTHRFEERFALLYSRFGVMFFDAPAAAFSNLRSALVPGGRMALAVWGPLRENEFAALPLAVLRRFMPAPDPVPGPGPFGLADPDALASLLEGAGFAQVSIARLEAPFEGEPAQLAEQGPAAAILRQAQADPGLRARFVEALTEALGGRKPRALALIVTGVSP